MFRSEKRLGDGAGDLILSFRYLKECHGKQELAFCIVSVDKIGSKGTKHVAIGAL